MNCTYTLVLNCLLRCLMTQIQLSKLDSCSKSTIPQPHPLYNCWIELFAVDDCRSKCWQTLAVMCRWRLQWPSPPPFRPWYRPWASKVVTPLSQPPLPIALTPPWPWPLLVARSLPPYNFSSASSRPTWRVPHHFLLSLCACLACLLHTFRASCLIGWLSWWPVSPSS